MNKFVLITATFGLPLLAFLMLTDAAATFYRPDEPEKLAYQVVEPEPEEEVADEPIEPVAEEEEAEAEVEVDAEPEAEIATDADAEGTEEVTPEAPATEQADTAEVEAAEQPTETATEDGQVAALTEDELAAGARAMRKCAACHQYERDRNGVGPHLVDVVGRQIGTVEGYKYSDALLALGEAGDVWTQEALIAWLEEPANVAPGTKMNFKVRDADERELIAAWLAANGS